ncbi:MAG: putative DNA binding domain-containing protein [bacterium]|nr:putative DNA binding domain-containing protein [bacterium]
MNDNELIKLVDTLRKYHKEVEWLEFKKNYTSKNLNEIGEYLSALTNSACLLDRPKGYLIYGIDNDTHEIVGTTFKPSKCKKGAEELEAWLARMLDPRLDFRIYEFNYSKDKAVTLFEIDKTKFGPINFSGSAYIRVGSSKKKLKDYREKERKIWQKTREISFETEYATDNISNDSVLDLLDYTGYFSLMKLSLPSNKAAILAKLCEEKIIVKFASKYKITNLGAILFAKDLNCFDGLKLKALRIVIYKGKNRVSTIKEFIHAPGYAVGFERFIDYINNQLPENEVIGKVFREQTKMYPDIAIRELVANTLFHQDFSIKGSVPMVEIFEDRIEISNPGEPIIDTLRLLDHKPISRNEELAAFMRRLRLCEERGSGIDKVIKWVEAYQLPGPDFARENSFFKVTLFAYKTLRKMNKQDKIRACYQHCCLRYVSGEAMTNTSLRERFNITGKNYPQSSRIISETLKEGLIKNSDPSTKSKRYVKYIPYFA